MEATNYKKIGLTKKPKKDICHSKDSFLSVYTLPPYNHKAFLQAYERAW